MSDICKKEMVEAGREIDNSIVEIEQTVALMKSNRAPASIQIDSKWEDWSLDLLKQNQRYLDIAHAGKNGREFRSQLSEIANHWVVFYGFSKKGDMVGMLRTLKVIQRIQGELQSSSCSLSSK
jgi:hypothetical protein